MDDTVLANETPDLIRFGGALTDQLFADPVRRLSILLRHALHSDKAHSGPTHRLADRFGINAVVLVALDGRFDELGRSQLDAKPTLLQLAPPMVRRCTRLQAHLRASNETLA